MVIEASLFIPDNIFQFITMRTHCFQARCVFCFLSGHYIIYLDQRQKEHFKYTFNIAEMLHSFTHKVIQYFSCPHLGSLK